MNAAEMLKVHRQVWDMPTLMEQHPEVIEHLAARYDVVFPEDFTGQVYVQHKPSLRMEKMGTTDVREAVVTLLEREAEVSKQANMAAWAESVLYSDPDADVSEAAYDEWFSDPEGDDPSRLSAGDGSAQRYFVETSL